MKLPSADVWLAKFRAISPSSWRHSQQSKHTISAVSKHSTHLPPDLLKPGTQWRQSGLLPKPATNRQQNRLSPIQLTSLTVLATTWIRQLVAVDYVTNLVDFVADTVDFVAMFTRPQRTVDFQQSRRCWIQLCRQSVLGFRCQDLVSHSSSNIRLRPQLPIPLVLFISHPYHSYTSPFYTAISKEYLTSRQIILDRYNQYSNSYIMQNLH